METEAIKWYEPDEEYKGPPCRVDAIKDSSVMMAFKLSPRIRVLNTKQFVIARWFTEDLSKEKQEILLALAEARYGKDEETQDINWCSEIGEARITGPYIFGPHPNGIMLTGRNAALHGDKWYLIAWNGIEDTPENRAILLDLWIIKHGKD